MLPAAAPQDGSGSEIEQRAVAYLSQEVPNWPRQNHCFSCHNNGDAARALYVARAMGYTVKPEALRETTAWLLEPSGWDDPKGDPGFSDLKLARIQFAAALAEAFRTGTVASRTALDRAALDRAALDQAAERLAEDQEDDGSWDVDVPGVVGSPATYGDALGTYMARQTLETAGESRFANAIARADRWVLLAKPAATVDVCAVALALAGHLGTGDSPAPPEPNIPVQDKLRGLVDRITSTQNSDGGWGAYPKSPSEAFDTAVALLALAASSGLDANRQEANGQEAIRNAVRKGREHLTRAQLPAGGWPETTRPSGFQSYAQHISTSGWATLALLKTRDFAE
jgi:hypothetical protein